MIQNFILLDSCVWLSYFFGDPRTKWIIEGDKPYATSVLSLFEIYRRLKQLKHKDEYITAALLLVQRRSLLLDVKEEIVHEAFQFFERLSAMDAIIYATARINDFSFITNDNDFRRLPNVTFL